MITLEPLQPSQYRTVAEWEHGKQPPGTDWAQYRHEMEQPGWWHYCASVDGEPSAHISLEERSPSLLRFHASSKPGSAIHPRALAEILLRIADYCFTGPYEECEAVAPRRAAARLAIRCGLTFRGETAEGRRYSITKTEREQHA